MIHSAQRILIVEDNKTDARLIRDLLERYGYETLQTGDGFEAMKLALECLPDLILMDIQLPEISGLDVTRRLKGDERSQDIPIIAVTALAMRCMSGRHSTAGVTPTSQNRYPSSTSCIRSGRSFRASPTNLPALM